MNKKVVLRWVKIGLLLYGIFGIAWYYGQDRLLLHPEKVSRDTPYKFMLPFREVNLPYDEGTNLNVVEFKPTVHAADSPARGVVLYFPGNTGNITNYAIDAVGFAMKGYEVWMMDYPGFGKSTGTFTEKNVYTYALVFYTLARSRWKPSQIVLFGEGLGTGIAAQLASVRDCRQLILSNPYYSMDAEFRRWLFLYPVGLMLHYHFPTYAYLPAVTAPVSIFDGDPRLRRLLKPGDDYSEEHTGGALLRN